MNIFDAKYCLLDYILGCLNCCPGSVYFNLLVNNPWPGRRSETQGAGCCCRCNCSSCCCTSCMDWCRRRWRHVLRTALQSCRTENLLCVAMGVKEPTAFAQSRTTLVDRWSAFNFNCRQNFACILVYCPFCCMVRRRGHFCRRIYGSWRPFTCVANVWSSGYAGMTSSETQKLSTGPTFPLFGMSSPRDETHCSAM